MLKNGPADPFDQGVGLEHQVWRREMGAEDIAGSAYKYRRNKHQLNDEVIVQGRSSIRDAGRTVPASVWRVGRAPLTQRIATTYCASG
jgi:hypothetical protein